MPLSIDLSGKKALVTGVSSGIGLGIARMLNEAGCDVAGCGRSAPSHPGALAFLEATRRGGRRGIYRSCDLTQEAGARTWVAEMAAELGAVDLLVSNAGRNVFTGAASCSEPEWSECMDLDLAAHWRTAQAARPHLDLARGVVLIITSNHAFSTIPGCFPYNVAKAGLVAMVQSMALEWGPAIRTIGIAPGFIDTPGNDTWFSSFPDPAAERLRTERLHPVGRIGTPAEIGALCAFLASPMAGFISGTTLLVDGGRSAVLQ